MKKLTSPLVALAAVALAFLFSVPQAEARGHRHHSHTYVSGHTSCGCKIYTKRYVKYYDCHGHPVYGYKRQPVKHRCHKHQKPRRSYRYNSCDSDYGYYQNRRRHRRSYSSCGNGWSISYRF